jgi:hypothetical protein
VKVLEIPDETFEFLAYLARQNATLPAVLADYLAWNRYTKEEIKAHLHVLNDACIKARQ